MQRPEKVPTCICGADNQSYVLDYSRFGATFEAQRHPWRQIQIVGSRKHMKLSFAILAICCFFSVINALPSTTCNPCKTGSTIIKEECNSVNH